MKAEIFIRDYGENDKPFVMNSWIKSYRDANIQSLKINKKLLYHNQKDLINSILTHSVTLVACADDDEDHILGWLNYEAYGKLCIIHYVYVKHPFRMLDIANTLKSHIHIGLDRPFILCSHKTRYFDVLQKKWNLIYNPYVLYEGK